MLRTVPWNDLGVQVAVQRPQLGDELGVVVGVDVSHGEWEPQPELGQAGGADGGVQGVLEVAIGIAAIVADQVDLGRIIW
jgi:hypothetical protein